MLENGVGNTYASVVLARSLEALTDSLRYEVSQLGVEVVEVQPSAYPTIVIRTTIDACQAKRGLSSLEANVVSCEESTNESAVAERRRIIVGLDRDLPTVRVFITLRCMLASRPVPRRTRYSSWTPKGLLPSIEHPSSHPVTLESAIS